MQPFYLTVSSVLTISLLDSILALLLCMLFRNRRVAAKIGPGCMLALLLAESCILVSAEGTEWIVGDAE